MNQPLQKVTKLFLKSLGLNDYLIREIIKGANFSVIQNGYRLYETSDLIKKINTKLSDSKTKKSSKKKLTKVLHTLQGKSNVIEADFLQKLPPEKRIAVLKNQLQELEVEEKKIEQETDELIQKANAMLMAN
ncbi:hypothetical protein PN462_03685 [Spirulina sp. CS-785/01]|uniref:hypothetical protein n=1 Tax=Spirulina sp. CS-785/01 TaxID=3021716 RepID=UPI00232E4F29|nr:hypothetical protein [Spirulina sp. CS-785/01]MDB9312192.1 hypothetical protein [Spirulina sp. CS-785/01]